MTATFLLDNSAWARLASAALPAQRAEQIASSAEEGRMLVSLPFLLEAGYSARSAAEHRAVLEELLAMPFVPIDRAVEERALDVQGRLARSGHHRLPPVDLLIAVLAERHGHGVLHYDRDYDLLVERGGVRMRSEWLAPRGSL